MLLPGLMRIMIIPAAMLKQWDYDWGGSEGVGVQLVRSKPPLPR